MTEMVDEWNEWMDGMIDQGGGGGRGAQKN